MFYGFPGVKTVAIGRATLAPAEHPVIHRKIARKQQKNAILKFFYFVGKILSFSTGVIQNKIKWLQIWEKVKFIFGFRKLRSNLFFFSKIVTVSWKITKKTEENIFVFQVHQYFIIKNNNSLLCYYSKIEEWKRKSKLKRQKEGEMSSALYITTATFHNHISFLCAYPLLDA